MRILLLLGVVTWYVTSSNAKLPGLNASKNIMNTFSNNFFKAVVDNNFTNVVCSPIGTSVVLWMSAMGAKGNTLKQLESALALDGGITHWTKFEMRSVFRDFRKHTQIKIGSTVLLGEGPHLNVNFLDLSRFTLDSEVDRVDFEKAAETSKLINDWGAIQTANCIKDIVKADDFKSDTSLVLVSDVYFEANWKLQFKLDETASRRFYLDIRRYVMVPTMRRVGVYGTGTLNDVYATFVELRYETDALGHDVSMFIILPNRNEGLAYLVQNFDNVTMERLRVQNQSRIEVLLPRFKIESSLDLQKPLSNMGLGDMFGDQANFTRMGNATELKVTNAVQKVFIEVGENGTKALAASEEVWPSQYIYNRLDRYSVDNPFVFIIATRSGTIVASGIIVNPDPNAEIHSH